MRKFVGCVHVSLHVCVVVYEHVCYFNIEEKYTWVLSPKDRTGDVGVHYLVMKPIVEPGVKSINATVTVTSIAAQCKYWNETESSWSEDGCRVSKRKTQWLHQCILGK